MGLKGEIETKVSVEKTIAQIRADVAEQRQ